MTKNIIFCFDGTDQEPSKAVQPSDYDPENKKLKDPGNLTNVAKLHLLFGGDFRGSDVKRTTSNSLYGISDQVSLYYSGVGTYGGPVRQVPNLLLALTDVKSIINEALEDLRRLYHENDKVFVVGFSRGAAIARLFCEVVDGKADLSNVEIEMLVCFDTVASIGMPDFSTENRPEAKVLRENNYKIADNIKQAVHCVSMDDKRRHFQPTLMNYEDKVTEVWFAGSHTDIGGGYFHDGLSDVVLQFVLDELKKRKVGLTILRDYEVDFAKINHETRKEGVVVEPDDIKIRPNELDTSHEQPMMLWCYHRRVVVIEGDKIVHDKLPIVHHSVEDRIKGLSNYRPQSLLGQPHKVLYADGTTRTFNDLNGHMKILEPGYSERVTVWANKRYNHSRFLLRQGERYRFTPDLNGRWNDGPHVCDARGWDRWHSLPFRPLKHLGGANWFSLVGAIKGGEEELFEIGGGPIEYEAKSSGEFCPFANDAKMDYYDNGGYIDVVVTCLPRSRL